SPQLHDLLRFALQDTIRHHLIADVPVGVFLSSGLDSTTLAALAAEQGGRLRTVTLGFEEFRGTANDEVPFAEAVARQYGAQHQTIWVARRDFQTHVNRLFDAMDQPSTDGVNTYFVSFAAARASLKVALSGLGGDELFGGYPSFREIPRLVKALRPLPFARSLGRALRVISTPVLNRFTSPKYAGLLEYGSSYADAYLLRRGLFMPWELPELLEPDLVREGWEELNTLALLNLTAGLLSQRSAIRDRRSVPNSDFCPLNSGRVRVSALEMCWYMRNQLLRDSDWAGMAHSLEIRVPLVDVAVLHAVAPLLASETPPTKRDMALTPRSPLPAALLARPKTGFSVPVRDWLLRDSQTFSLNAQPRANSRGLRGWARQVYDRFTRN
ncbi:MAG: asparagine synthase C-terminal domain-containing protein, partial [Verrucomicrobiota bacterium]